MMLKTVKAFKKIGLLGMNARVGNYILPFNPRKNYPRVDDKVLTDKLAKDYEIPMPQNYYVFERFGDIKKLSDLLKPHFDFVIKPSKGAMGNGILVIGESQNENYAKTSGKVLTIKDIKYHISSILSGLYSLDGYPDKAIVQYRIKLHEKLKEISYQGIPDIRVIIFRGYPVMAMTRLPTSLSDGRANLHQGAIGAGINLKTGKTVNAILKNSNILKHPDTNCDLIDFEIPQWTEILKMAVKCYELSGLGYVGVDIAIDNELGPMVIELNARPGLSIQLANICGLNTRLKQINKIFDKNHSPSDRIQSSLSAF